MSIKTGVKVQINRQRAFVTSISHRSMTGMNGHSPLEFVSIGKGIYLRRGKAVEEQGASKDPNVILVFGWMAAQLAHIHKYTKVYEEMYPNATQVLVRSEPSFFWSSERTQRANLQPVIQTLEALGCIPSAGKNTEKIEDTLLPINEKPRILVHSFSNGGAMQLITLGEALRRRGIASSSYHGKPPVSALVIDSSPANGTYQSTIRAFTAHIKNPFLRFTMKTFITFLHVFRLIVERGLGFQPIFTRLKTILNSPHTLPWMDDKTPRLYIFSKKDELIPWMEVTEHVKDGQNAGLNVTSEVFETSSHVAHGRADPTRYWTAVKDVWRKAIELVRV